MLLRVTGSAAALSLGGRSGLTRTLPEVDALHRLMEETPRERAAAELAVLVRDGLDHGRTLAAALQNHGNDPNPATSDLPSDRTWREFRSCDSAIFGKRSAFARRCLRRWRLRRSGGPTVRENARPFFRTFPSRIRTGRPGALQVDT